MFVNNKENRIIQIHTAAERTDDNAPVVHDVIRLIPGINEVDPADWKAAKKSKTRLNGKDINLVDHYIELGLLEEVKAPPGQTGPEGVKGLPTRPTGFSGYDPAQAKKLISQTFDRDLLKEGLQSETREEVRKMLETQLDKVTKDEEKEKK